MKNKVLKEYIKNRLIGSSVLCLTIVAFVWMSDSKLSQKYLKTKKYYNNDNNKNMNIVIKIMITLCCSLLFGSHAADTVSRARTKSSDLTKKYLDYISKTYPDAAHFQNIINDPAVIEPLCDFICNSLSKQDTDEIIKLASTLDFTVAKAGSLEHQRKIIAKFENDILSIVKKRIILTDDVIKNLSQKNTVCFNSKDNLQR